MLGKQSVSVILVFLIFILTILVIIWNAPVYCKKSNIQTTEDDKRKKSVELITLKDVTINGVRADGILDEDKLRKLGKPVKVDEEEVEEGKFRSYIYNTFQLDTQYDESEKCWYMSWFYTASPKFRTLRGVKIGDDANTVFKKYGSKPISDNVLIYKNNGMIVQFNFKKNKVIEIGLH